MSKPKKQNLVTLMRELRKVLPGTVKKESTFVYSVNDLVFIELNYYCSWISPKSKEDRAKDCNPHSVSVRLYDKSVSRTLKSVFSSRSFGKRKDGTINCEAIATAVTKALNSYDEYQAKQAQHKKEELEEKKLIQNETTRLANLIRENTTTKVLARNYDWGKSHSHVEAANLSVRTYTEYDENNALVGFTYDLDMNDIQPTVIDAILIAIAPTLNNE